MKALGSFRGKIEDAAVGIASGGFPQLTLKLGVEEMYDESAKEWAAWEDFWDEGSNEVNDRTIFAYLVLFGEKGATLSCDQIKLITGWAGDSFKSLEALELIGTKIQWRNAENTYQGKTNVQVAFVDLFDAAPGGSCKKIDEAAIASLDAKFAEFLGGGTNKPESKKGARGSKAKTDAAPKEDTAKEETTEEKSKTGGRRGRKPAAPKTEAAATTTPPQDTAPPDEPVDESALFTTIEPCTKQEAWTAVCESKKATVTVDELTKVWQTTIAKVAPGKSQADLTGEDWSAVRAGVLDDIS